MDPSTIILIILLGGVTVYSSCLIVACCPEATHGLFVWDSYYGMAATGAL